MKKYLVIAIGLMLVLAACNKTAFVNKLQGTWKLNKYLFDGLDKTLYYDTTNRNYTLTIFAVDEEEHHTGPYSIDWQTYAFKRDSIILSDTLGYDTPNMVYSIKYDTIRYIDTTITPFMQTGRWALINSDEDLQLRNDSDNTVSIYRILDLGKSNLNLRKGNEEIYFKK